MEEKKAKLGLKRGGGLAAGKWQMAKLELPQSQRNKNDKKFLIGTLEGEDVLVIEERNIIMMGFLLEVEMESWRNFGNIVITRLAGKISRSRKDGSCSIDCCYGSCSCKCCCSCSWMQESMELGSFTLSYCQPASCRCLDTSSHCGEIVAVKEGQEMRSCHNLHGYF